MSVRLSVTTGRTSSNTTSQIGTTSWPISEAALINSRSLKLGYLARPDRRPVPGGRTPFRPPTVSTRHFLLFRTHINACLASRLPGGHMFVSVSYFLTISVSPIILSSTPRIFEFSREVAMTNNFRFLKFRFVYDWLKKYARPFFLQLVGLPA